MEKINEIGDYLITNYYILIIIGSVIVLAIIGYIADKKKSEKNAKMNSEIRLAEDINNIKKTFKGKGLSINEAVTKSPSIPSNEQTTSSLPTATSTDQTTSPPTSLEPTMAVEKPASEAKVNDAEVL